MFTCATPARRTKKTGIQAQPRRWRAASPACWTCPTTRRPPWTRPTWPLKRRPRQRAPAAITACTFGAGEHNAAEAARLAPRCTGLKLYLDATFGPLRLDDLHSLEQHFAQWPSDRPILAHAEGRTVAAVLFIAQLYDRPVHICHVSKRDEIELIAAARAHGVRVTCEVCPHHMFLTRDSGPAAPGFIEVRPAAGHAGRRGRAVGAPARD